MPRGLRAPSRAEPVRDASANDVSPTRTALFAPPVETGDRFRVDASVRKHTAEGGRAWTPYSPGRDDAPCAVGFGVVQADSRIASEYDEELRKVRKIRRQLGLELVALTVFLNEGKNCRVRWIRARRDARASKEDAFERHRDETRDDRRVHVAHWVARLRRHARSCADVAFSRNSFAARSRRVRDRGRDDARRGASCVSRCVL